MISLTPSRSLRRAGPSIHSAPPAAAASAMSGRRKASGPGSARATPVAKMAPRMICPSSPMFQKLARKARAAARPTTMSGAAWVSTAASARGLPNRVAASSRPRSERGTPAPTRMRAEARSPIATPLAVAAGDSHGGACRRKLSCQCPPARAASGSRSAMVLRNVRHGPPWPARWRRGRRARRTRPSGGPGSGRRSGRTIPAPRLGPR